MRQTLLRQKHQIALSLAIGVQHAAFRQHGRKAVRLRRRIREQRLDPFLLRVQGGGDPVVDLGLGVELGLFCLQLVFHGDQVVLLAQKLIGCGKAAALPMQLALVLRPEGVAGTDLHAQKPGVLIQIDGLPHGGGKLPGGGRDRQIGLIHRRKALVRDPDRQAKMGKEAGIVLVAPASSAFFNISSTSAYSNAAACAITP